MIKRFQSLFGYFISETCCGRPQSFCTSIKLSGPRLYAGNIGEVETPPESSALFSHSGRALLCSVNPRLQLTLLSRDNQKHAFWKMWDESTIKIWRRAVVSEHTNASVFVNVGVHHYQSILSYFNRLAPSQPSVCLTSTLLLPARIFCLSCFAFLDIFQQKFIRTSRSLPPVCRYKPRFLIASSKRINN